MHTNSLDLSLRTKGRLEIEIENLRRLTGIKALKIAYFYDRIGAKINYLFSSLPLCICTIKF